MIGLTQVQSHAHLYLALYLTFWALEVCVGDGDTAGFLWDESSSASRNCFLRKALPVPWRQQEEMPPPPEPALALSPVTWEYLTLSAPAFLTFFFWLEKVSL